MTVDTESGNPFLGMGRQYRRQVHRPGPFGAVKAPDSFYCGRVHVHGFRTVAPAGGYGKGDVHPFAAEFVRAGGGFRNPADGGVGDHRLHRLPVGIAEVLFKKRLCRLCHVHGLIFQRLPNLKRAPPSVNCRPDPDFGVHSPVTIFCHFILHLFQSIIRTIYALPSIL